MRGGITTSCLSVSVFFIVVSLSAAEPVACRVHADCGLRSQCGNWDTPDTCMCIRDLLFTNWPQCYEPASWQILYLLLVFGGNCLVHAVACVPFCVALYAHMKSDEQSKVKWWIRLVSLKVYFLITAAAASACMAIREAIWVANMFDSRSPFTWLVTSRDSSYQIVFALWFVFTFQSLLAIACIWLRVAARLYNPSKPRTLLWRFILALDQTYLGPILAMLFIVPFSSFYAYLLAAGHFILAGFLAPLVYMSASVGFWGGAKLLLSARRVDRGAVADVSQAQAGDRRGPGSASVMPIASPTPGSPSSPNSPQSAVAAEEEGKPKARKATEAFSSERYIDSVSSVTLRLSKNIRTSGSGVQPWKRSFYRDASFSGSDVEQDDSAYSGVSGSQDEDGALEARVLQVHQSACALARRISWYTFVSAACIMVYPILDMQDMEWLIQLLAHTAFILMLLANLNCLYYLSPSLRPLVQYWVHSNSLCLSCLGVAIDPQPI